MVARSLAALMLLAVCGRLPAAGLETDDGRVKDVVARIGNTPGIGVVLGDDRCRLAIALAKRSRMIWYVQLPDAEAAEAASRAADAEGMYGTRIFVAQGSPARIGLADNLADVVVAADDPAGVGRIGNPSSVEAHAPDGLAIRPTVTPDQAEILRVLRPEGRAIVGRQEWVKPFPPGVDDWSHHYHGPDNNPLLARLAGPGAVPHAVRRRAPLRARPAGGRGLRRAAVHGFRARRLAPTGGALAQHAGRPERLQRRHALDASADAGDHGRPQHDDRHARDALPGRRPVVQAAGPGQRQGAGPDRPARRG